MPTARNLLAMASYKALPKRFANVDEATAAPKFATWAMGVTLAIYLGLSLTSDWIVADSVYSVGISICVYYIVASLSSVVYFHRTAFASVRTAFGQVILPAIAVIVLSLCAGRRGRQHDGSRIRLWQFATGCRHGVHRRRPRDGAGAIPLMLAWRRIRGPRLLQGTDAAQAAGALGSG